MTVNAELSKNADSLTINGMRFDRCIGSKPTIPSDLRTFIRILSDCDEFFLPSGKKGNEFVVQYQGPIDPERPDLETNAFIPNELRARIEKITRKTLNSPLIWTQGPRGSKQSTIQ